MTDPEYSEGTFTVTMLAVLREPFERWLASRGLVMEPIPETDALVVVPGPELSAPLPGWGGILDRCTW